MALGTTNISTTLIRNTLGESNNNVFSLCTSSLINKWSKYKPIRDAGVGSNRPAGSNSKYGLNLPTDWSYLQPRGGSPGGSPDEPGRLGDFKGYEHTAYPTMHLLNSEKSVSNLNPTAGPTTNTWKIRVYRSASNVLILPSDLGLDSYYVGIKISGSYVATMYRTIFQVSSGSSSGTDFSVQAAYNYSTNNFQDLPIGRGTYNYQFFISSTATTYSGGSYQWTASAPSNIINLPHEGSYISSGSFDVSRFIYVSDPAPVWSYSQYGVGQVQRVYIGTTDSYKYTGVPASDISGWTIKNPEGTQIGENEVGAGGDYIDIYPNNTNSSTTTSKIVNLTLVSLEDGSVTRTITLTQYFNDSPADPIVQYDQATGDPWGLTDNGDGYINTGSNVLHYDFWHDETVNVYAYYGTVRDAANNVVYGPTGGFTIEPEFPNVTGSVVINRNAVAGDVFTLTLTS